MPPEPFALRKWRVDSVVRGWGRRVRLKLQSKAEWLFGLQRLLLQDYLRERCTLSDQEHQQSSSHLHSTKTG
jgi:hypothetical protein